MMSCVKSFNIHLQLLEVVRPSYVYLPRVFFCVFLDHLTWQSKSPGVGEYCL